MPFQPGQSGNPSGIKRAGQWRAMLDRAITADDKQRLRQAAEALLDAASSGDLNAIKELADRLDGKPNQQLQLEGGETPILTKAIVELIHASGSDAKTPTP